MRLTTRLPAARTGEGSVVYKPAGSCPPGPIAAHGYVNGWRAAPGWSEAERLGGHCLPENTYSESSERRTKEEGRGIS